jgi:phage-related protein
MVDQTWSDLGYIFTRVGDLAGSVADLAAQVAQGIGHGISSAVSSVSDWVGRALADVRNWVGAIYNQLHDWVARGLSDLGGLIDHVWHAVLNDVYDPLKRLVDGAWNFLTKTVVPTIRGWVDDVKGWATDALKWLLGILGTVVDWVEHVAKPAIAILGKAERFLLFVIAHPLDWWLVAIEDVVGKAPGYLIGLLTRGAEQGMGQVEELASKWIG